MIDNLITVEEFATFRDISVKRDVGKIDESIKLAQNGDFQKAIGDFYFDVLKNKDEADYSLLMDGGDFQDNGESFYHFGLKAYLADLAYSRYILKVNINITPFGAQNKYTDDSNNVDRLTLRDESKQAQKDADHKFESIKRYMLTEKSLFDRFCRGLSNRASYQGVKISNLDSNGKSINNETSEVLNRRYNIGSL